MKEYIQVLTTVDTEEKAREIAHAIVDRRLAACVQILGGVESIFWWEGKKEEAREWMLFIKTTMDLYSRLEEAIKEVHPYEVPEIIALPIVDGNNDYLRWIADETERA